MADMRALQGYFLLLAAYKAANRAAFEARQKLIDDRGWKPELIHDRYQAADKDAEVVRLQGEASSLYEKVQAGASLAIAANLEAFGLEDRVVTGVVRTEGRVELGRLEAKLSELCVLRARGIAKRLEVEKEGARFASSLPIYDNGVEIGFVDSDGVLTLSTGTVREVLGYKLATDGGRERLVRVDLDAAAQRVLDLIRTEGTAEDVFFGAFSELLKEVIVYEEGSRYSDGYCPAKNPIWRAATRELGEPHNGYSFCC